LAQSCGNVSWYVINFIVTVTRIRGTVCFNKKDLWVIFASLVWINLENIIMLIVRSLQYRRWYRHHSWNDLRFRDDKIPWFSFGISCSSYHAPSRILSAQTRNYFCAFYRLAFFNYTQMYFTKYFLILKNFLTNEIKNRIK